MVLSRNRQTALTRGILSLALILVSSCASQKLPPTGDAAPLAEVPIRMVAAARKAPRISDDDLIATIQHMASLAGLSVSNVNAESRNGHVRIFGEVPDMLIGSRLARAVESIPGVRSVAQDFRTASLTASAKPEQSLLGFLFSLLALPIGLALVLFAAVVIYVETRLAIRERKAKRSAAASASAGAPKDETRAA